MARGRLHRLHHLFPGADLEPGCLSARAGATAGVSVGHVCGGSVRKAYFDRGEEAFEWPLPTSAATAMDPNPPDASRLLNGGSLIMKLPATYI